MRIIMVIRGLYQGYQVVILGILKAAAHCVLKALELNGDKLIMTAFVSCIDGAPRVIRVIIRVNIT